MSDNLLTTDLFDSSGSATYSTVATDSPLETAIPELSWAASSASLAQAQKAPSPSVLWRNGRTGANQIWQFEGTQRTATQTLPSLGTNWQVVGIGDFNRDSSGSSQSGRQDDLLWRNFATGELQIWTLNGATVQSFALPQRSLDWQVRGIGDFDADGKNDIVWRNSRTGENAIWFLDDTTYRSEQLFFTITDTDWKISGVGDFDGDRQADLVWKNTATGETALWLMERATIKQSSFLLTVKDPDWKIVGVRDFDRDGKLDVLWHNDRSRQNLYWQFDRANYQDMVWLPLAPENSQIISTVDFDGDGNADLLWHNSATGKLTRWLMEGKTLRSSTTLEGADPQWQAVGVLQNSVASVAALQVATIPTVYAASTVGELTAASSVSPGFSLRGQVSAGKLSDFYRFDLSSSGVFTATLEGLTADADVRLIRDGNANGAIDIETGEILAWQWERGSRSEGIRRFLEPGTYYVQVMSYKGQSTGYSVSTNFTSSASDPEQFHINLIFADSLAGLSTAAQDAIRNAARFWERVITHRSATTRSNELNITISGQSLINSDGTADNATLALSGPSVGLDENDTLVITRGNSTLNTRKFADFNANPGYLESIMRHEFVHVLGFGTLWEPVEFRTADGTIIRSRPDRNNFVDRATSTYSANSYAGEVYGEWLGTDRATIPIEPRIFAHWDESRFDAELMTPYTEGLSAATPLSILTLAALRDLGWNINFGAAEAYAPPQTVSQVAASPGAPTQVQARSLVAASRCGCSRCIADIPGNPLTAPRLEDIIAA